MKEAIIYAIGSLVDQIRDQKDLKAMMEPMLLQYILPELSNPQPFLRMRALWMYGEFGSHRFKDEAHIKSAIDAVYKCLHEPNELPVRLTAATSIHKLLNNETAAELLKPALKTVLEAYLKLMTEIESEELVSALEEIVSHFKDDIEPYAV